VQRQHADNPLQIGGAKPGDIIPKYKPGGRWPSNLYLSHTPDCHRIGERRVKGAVAVRHKSGGNTCHTENTKPPMADMTYADADGMETLAAWDCVESCPVRRLGEQSGVSNSGNGRRPHYASIGYHGSDTTFTTQEHGDTGTAARFYFNSNWSHEIAERLATCDPVKYQAKAGRKERDAGLGGFALGEPPGSKRSKPAPGRKNALGEPRRNSHPTIKPIALARWLATLLLPPELYAPRRILIPFAGSGSEMIGALLAGWEEIVGIEMETEYVEIAEARLVYWASRPIQRELL